MGATVPVVLASCGESLGVFPKLTSTAESRLSGPTFGLRAADPWRMPCQHRTRCQRSFLTALARWQQVLDCVTASKQQHTAEKSFNINTCHIHILDAFPSMIMMDAQAIQSQRSALSFIIRWLLEPLVFEVPQSQRISNQAVNYPDRIVFVEERHNSHRLLFCSSLKY